MKIDKNSLPENVRGLVNKTKIELLNIIDRKDNVEKELNIRIENMNRKVAEIDKTYDATKKSHSEICEKYKVLIIEHQKLQQDYLDLKEGYEELENEDKVLLSNSKSLKNDIDRLLNEKRELEAMNKTLNEKCNSLNNEKITLLSRINSIDNVKKQLIDDKEKLIDDKEKLSKDYHIILNKLKNCNKNNSYYKFMFVVYTIIVIVFLLCILM